MACPIKFCINSRNKKSGNDFKWYSFPSDPSTKLKWFERCKDEEKISKWSKVCSNHFSAEDYEKKNLGENYIEKKKMLQKSAVPKGKNQIGKIWMGICISDVDNRDSLNLAFFKEKD